ncbi:ABC transporter ATP-binding protein [Sphaerisporangium krabiense]|uniref:ATP-binding cassette subfamily C protein n=1 Tax=Sphaerisporangium krabiense TaxID=763782 RepID=A0A7W8Z4M8_9ACTN|nr:ABC transporter ATP-binding protein [Sphaerisporangium krabiense]MBB5627378.1 ATP-binding cassette subfamily C protein [Sphaerisporangium krabiense]GII64486.1 ABC transporter ATP-binding protein [Sphaerisporangium krabiense]
MTGVRLLTRHARAHRGALLRMAAWSVAEALPALLTGLLVARALDAGFLAGDVVAGLGYVGLLAVCLLAQAAATRQVIPHLGDFVEPLRDTTVAAVLTGALGRAVHAAHHPDTTAIAQLTKQTEQLRGLTSGLLRTVRPLAVQLVMALAGLTVLNGRLGMLAAPPILFALGLFAWSLPALARRQQALLSADEEIAGACGAYFAGLRDVTACGAESRAAAHAATLIDRQARATRALAWAGAVRTIVIAVGGHVPVVLALLAAPEWIREGRLTAGEVAGAVTYLVTVLLPALRSAVGLIGSWGVQFAALLDRLGATMAPPEPSLPENSSPPVLETPGPAVSPGSWRRSERPAGAVVELRDVTFAYGPGAEPVIDGLSLRVEAGSRLAVVGPSGIGKSTLADLIAGLRSPLAGRVRLTTDVALIPQEAYVFTGTLGDNLRYLRPGASDDDLRAAVKAVGMEALAARLGGPDGHLDPAALSAGERQLVSLARVHLSPARLVILDEATCHLDPVAEARAESAFATRPGTTLIVIAHRMTSALRADRVLVLDGTKAALGTHDELVASSPLYAELTGRTPALGAPVPARTAATT